MPVEHPTASTFLYARFADCWRLGLIAHPRLGGELVAGGHCEPGEHGAESAVREVLEETGRQPTLLPPPHGLHLPADYPHPIADCDPATPLASRPWWTVVIPAAADSRVAERHIHLDDIFVGVATRPYALLSIPEHPFRWVTREELVGLDVPADTRILGTALFSVIAEQVAHLAPGRVDEPALRRELAVRMQRDQQVRTVPRNERSTPEHQQQRWRAVDEDNRNWLRSLLHHRGAWPTRSAVGAAGSTDLFLLAQHADPDRGLQEHCAELLGQAVAAGEAEPHQLALLEDRLAVAARQEQWFGSQFHREKDGTLTPFPIREPSQVDTRRAWHGLAPMREYAQQLVALD
ncbi:MULTISPECIES: DUF6624 domain-containing protein [unclassified Streptomyces]|uniref:DUF6624 domain-containing protein n=1 Tax=unclassified Streptomyces TaxID=2593676 RepID=UPI00363118F4